MSPTRVKICGVTTEEEREHLAECGVEFFGLQVDVASPWAISSERARLLARHDNAEMRATLVTRPQSAERLETLIRQIGVRAIQLGGLASPQHIRHLRRTFGPGELTILQEFPFAGGRFSNEERLDEFLAAGADWILLDKLEKAESGDGDARGTIPPDQLAAFRDRHAGKPIMVAGGVTAQNARALMAASGATGVDVCSAVRRDGRICRELVTALVDALPRDYEVVEGSKPSLRSFLNSVGSGNHVIAYLTLGDPAERFLKVVDDVLAAGALTLELGFPHPKPREGEALVASHERALAAGTTGAAAFAMLRTIAERYPDKPLVAVVQGSAISSDEEICWFLDNLAIAGGAAVLPVGMPFWQLPALAARAGERSIETVIACPPDATRRLRAIVLRYCTGCLYVPRGRVTGGAADFGPVPDFCERVASESDVPMVVGVGVKEPRDVAEICRTPAKAAAVGSALVEHVATGGSAGEFIRRLLGG